MNVEPWSPYRLLLLVLPPSALLPCCGLLVRGVLRARMVGMRVCGVVDAGDGVAVGVAVSEAARKNVE